MSSAYSFVWQFPLPERPQPLPADQPEAFRHQELTKLKATLAEAALKVTSGSELLRSLERSRRTESIPTAVSAIDRLLGGGIARGKLVEVTGKRSAGRFSAAISALASITGTGEATALIDLGDHFDPQDAESAGVDLRRLLWVRPQKLKDAVAAAEMALTTGFALVVLDLGVSPIRGRGRVAEGSWVRLARAAEAHGGSLLVSTPYAISRTASEAVISSRSARALWQGSGKMPRLLLGTSATLTLERHRHMRPGATERVSFSVAERIRCS